MRSAYRMRSRRWRNWRQLAAQQKGGGCREARQGGLKGLVPYLYIAQKFGRRSSHCVRRRRSWRAACSRRGEGDKDKVLDDARGSGSTNWRMRRTTHRSGLAQANVPLPANNVLAGVKQGLQAIAKKDNEWILTLLLSGVALGIAVAAKAKAAKTYDCHPPVDTESDSGRLGKNLEDAIGGPADIPRMRFPINRRHTTSSKVRAARMPPCKTGIYCLRCASTSTTP